MAVPPRQRTRAGFVRRRQRPRLVVGRRQNAGRPRPPDRQHRRLRPRPVEADIPPQRRPVGRPPGKRQRRPAYRPGNHRIRHFCRPRRTDFGRMGFVRHRPAGRRSSAGQMDRAARGRQKRLRFQCQPDFRRCTTGRRPVAAGGGRGADFCHPARARKF